MEKVISENWDLDVLYAGGKDSAKLNNLITQLKYDLRSLNEKIKPIEVSIKTGKTQDLIELFQEVQKVLNGSFELDEYVICLYAVNVDDPDIAKLEAESANIKSDFDSLMIDIDELLANIPEQTWRELVQHEEVKSYQFYLEEHKQRVKDKLPLEMEKLINQLSKSGFVAWENYYEQLMGTLRFPVEMDGKVESFSIGQIFGPLMSNNRAIRQKAAYSIVNVLNENADSFATVLNNIQGFRLDVYKRRGWDNILKESLDQNRISEQTVATMLSTIQEDKDIIQTYLKRKARVMNLEKLGWYDADVPSYTSDKKISYNEAAEIITSQFYHFSEKLGNFAERAFNEGWIEAENRPGKMHGGFCASMPLAKESRIFLTYTGSYQDVVTIAHELGHAYHNSILHDELAFSQQTSTSVAETASTFAENLVLDAAIEHATNVKDKLTLLEMKITNGLKYQASVPTMFEFEKRLYEKRKHGPLTSSEISDILDEMLRNLYGDIVDDTNKFLWINIHQFFSTDLAFYNIPYTIGYLFSNGIYALAKEKGSGFPKQYDELLRNSGKMTVEQLADNFLDQNITKKDFWQASLQPVKDAIETYLQLTEKMD
ncbi:M3 family oligoendopeptidase [Virgibacillus halodenitrificans]|uniref:Oligoendopeptidase F n=1 Tax=Virgibacillus halodenitrificans TaxID=1482 RepID=A0AAC9IZP8_VIRHA|nr:M3 family oligoendopeptidase [Virgibacillus halodenitrificans]APC48846.1 oligoendopeptidase F [Virgibacillus halodenitrificans]MCG1029394.1 M3 family oligoendopeptidase [Virgibacillus halodenitrificans]